MAGKFAGGLTYGYKAVTKFAASGEPIRGDREINPVQATVVRRIFGTTPMASRRRRSRKR